MGRHCEYLEKISQWLTQTPKFIADHLGYNLYNRLSENRTWLIWLIIIVPIWLGNLEVLGSWGLGLQEIPLIWARLEQLSVSLYPPCRSRSQEYILGGTQRLPSWSPVWFLGVEFWFKNIHPQLIQFDVKKGI